MKRAMFLIGGVCWLAFALMCGVWLVRYLVEGAGLQFFGIVVSSVSVLMGMIHVIGLGMAAIVCFAIGAGLCAMGMVAGDGERR